MSENEKKNQLSEESKLVENKVSDDFRKEKASENSLNKETPKSSFSDDLGKSVKNLWYMSETDAEVEVFIGKKADAVTKKTLSKQINVSPEIDVEEKDFADFFENLTEIQDWYGDEEKETAVRFSEVQKLLEENLRDLKVFKVGQIEIDIYAVGLDSQNILTGIKTKVVET